MDDKDLREITSDALSDFWERVAKRIPDANTGDLSPERTAKLEEAAFDAVKEWYNNNVKDLI